MLVQVSPTSQKRFLTINVIPIWRALIKIVAPQALPLPKAGDRRTRKMSPAAGAGGGDAVAPDYHRDRLAGGKRATLKG